MVMEASREVPVEFVATRVKVVALIVAVGVPEMMHVDGSIVSPRGKLAELGEPGFIPQEVIGAPWSLRAVGDTVRGVRTVPMAVPVLAKLRLGSSFTDRVK